MTEEERERERLNYIWESIGRVQQYSQGGKESFFRESIIQDAVLRRLETLADATNKLSDPLKKRHPEIPWQRIYGFRHIAAHAYEDLDLARVWEIVENYLPALEVAVAEELAERSGDGV